MKTSGKWPGPAGSQEPIRHHSAFAGTRKYHPIVRGQTLIVAAMQVTERVIIHLFPHDIIVENLFVVC